MHQSAHIVQGSEGEGQDRARILRFGGRVVLAVADGAGGRSGGAEAADLAIKTVSELASGLYSVEDCTNALLEADAAVEADSDAGETTFVLAVIDENLVYGASIGDSGAWIVNDASIDDLTVHQQRRPFLGDGAVPVGFSRPELDGTIMLASDGLLKYTSREKIAHVIRVSALEAACSQLVQLVRYGSGHLPDDVAIAICRHA